MSRLFPREQDAEARNAKQDAEERKFRLSYDLTQPPIKYNKAGFGNVYLRPHNSAEDYTCGVTWAKFKSNEVKM